MDYSNLIRTWFTIWVHNTSEVPTRGIWSTFVGSWWNLWWWVCPQKPAWMTPVAAPYVPPCTVHQSKESLHLQADTSIISQQYIYIFQRPMAYKSIRPFDIKDWLRNMATTGEFCSEYRGLLNQVMFSDSSHLNWWIHAQIIRCPLNLTGKQSNAKPCNPSRRQCLPDGCLVMPQCDQLHRTS